MSSIQRQIERSSLGTPSARAARATIPDETAARLVAAAKALNDDGHSGPSKKVGG